MNREMQSKLVAVLRDAMNAQGITQSDIARHIGTSSGMVSQAFSCKGQMRDERWRMCCEFCGVDFDRFMESQQHEVGQRPTNESECLHSPSVASTRPCAGEWPNQSRAEQSRAEQSRAEQSRAEQTEPVHDEKEVHTMPVVKNTVSVELTATQCLILKNFIEDELFPVIRSNHELGSFAWLSDLVDAHHTLAKAVACHEECSA